MSCAGSGVVCAPCVGSSVICVTAGVVVGSGVVCWFRCRVCPVLVYFRCRVLVQVLCRVCALCWFKCHLLLQVCVGSGVVPCVPCVGSSVMCYFRCRVLGQVSCVGSVPCVCPVLVQLPRGGSYDMRWFVLVFVLCHVLC